jgi:hypothetical protein
MRVNTKDKTGLLATDDLLIWSMARGDASYLILPNLLLRHLKCEVRREKRIKQRGRSNENSGEVRGLNKEERDRREHTGERREKMSLY